jgi:hypothetical protein
MSDTQPIDLNSASLASDGMRAASPIPSTAIDEFRISHVQRSDGWIGACWPVVILPRIDDIGLRKKAPVSAAPTYQTLRGIFKDLPDAYISATLRPWLGRTGSCCG